jgi:hypothetical protein
MRRPLRGLFLPVLLGLLLLFPLRAWAGPVSWKEVPPTAEGRQWWDEGSLRRNRSGHLTGLSRFQAASEVEDAAAAADPSPGTAAPAGSLPAGLDQRPAAASRSAPPISRLYVMELDCDQSLYRDISINGLPQFGAPWQPTGSDDLTAEVLRQACAAEAA